MNGAGTDDYQQAVVLAMDDFVGGFACEMNGFRSGLLAGELTDEVRRRR
jgi:hypothetical protein